MLRSEPAAAMERALRSWPQLAPAPLEFESHVAALSVAAQDLELHGAELYLAFACARGDGAAIRIFDRDYLAPTAQVVARVRNAPEFVDEVQQALRERLLVGPEARIVQYAATGSLGAWLRVSALRVALNHVRANRSRQELLVEAIVEPSLFDAGSRQAYAERVETAVHEAFDRLSPRQRNILRLHYLEALNIDQIGALYGMHRATVARWLARAREEILESVEQVIQRELRLTASEAQSVLRDVRSRLQVSVARLLHPENEPEADKG